MASLYQYVTLNQVLQEIANRLYDPDMVFWTPAELSLYLNESLQVFNSLSWYWRGDFTFNVVPNSTWYDLTNTDQIPNTLRPFTVTDVNLYTLMEYHLLEPPTGATWTGTPQFSIDDLLNAVQRRWNEILSITGCTTTYSIIPAVSNQTRNLVADNVLDIRRIAYFSPTGFTGYGQGGYGGGVYGGGASFFNGYGQSGFGTGPYGGLSLFFSNVLWKEDLWAFQSYETNWTTQRQGMPLCYATSSEPPLAFDTDVPPNQNGLYELITVNAGAQLNTSQPTLINIPSDFCWVLKYGALADLFSKESEAQDLPRADYCNKRYQQGLALLMNSPSLFQLRVNNSPVFVDSIVSSDLYNTTWESQYAYGQTFANLAIQSGLNTVALTPFNTQNVSSATATVLQNAPLPSGPNDYVQIPMDNYDVMVDYAVHVAMLKCGGAEATSSKYLFDRMVKQSSVMNSKLMEMGCFSDAITGQSQREEMENPRLKVTQ